MKKYNLELKICFTRIVFYKEPDGLMGRPVLFIYSKFF